MYNIITEFYVIDLESPNNAILGQPWIQMMKAVSFSYHQLLWYPTPSGTADIRVDQEMSRSIVDRSEEVWVDGEECEDSFQSRPPLEEKAEIDRRSIAITRRQRPKTNSSDESKAPDNRSGKDAELVYVDPSYLKWALWIGANLPADEKIQFNGFFI